MSATIEAITHRWVVDPRPTLGGAERVRRAAVRVNGLDDFWVVVLRVRSGIVDWRYASLFQKLYGDEPPSLGAACGYLVLLLDQWHSDDRAELRRQQCDNLQGYLALCVRVVRAWELRERVIVAPARPLPAPARRPV